MHVMHNTALQKYLKEIGPIQQLMQRVAAAAAAYILLEYYQV